MNAPPEGLATKDRQHELHERVRGECAQMLRLIDAQLADIEEIARNLRAQRAKWAAWADEGLPSTHEKSERAPRGAIRELVLRELEATAEGLDANTLTRRLSALLPSMNPRSVRQALTKLAGQGLVERDAGRWRKCK